jgi:hypothetical protein
VTNKEKECTYILAKSRQQYQIRIKTILVDHEPILGITHNHKIDGDEDEDF